MYVCFIVICFAALYVFILNIRPAVVVKGYAMNFMISYQSFQPIILYNPGQAFDS